MLLMQVHIVLIIIDNLINLCDNLVNDSLFFTNTMTHFILSPQHFEINATKEPGSVETSASTDPFVTFKHIVTGRSNLLSLRCFVPLKKMGRSPSNWKLCILMI